MHILTKLNCFTVKKEHKSIPIFLITEDKFESWLETQNNFTQKFINISKIDKTNIITIPNSEGSVDKVVCCVSEDMFSLADITSNLIDGNYHVEYSQIQDLSLIFMGIALGDYDFNHYKSKKHNKSVKIFLPESYSKIIAEIEATYLVRDMISTPAEDMGPEDISNVIKTIANKFNADVSEIVGEDLAKLGYMGIYSVGKGSHRDSRLVNMTWGDTNNPLVSIVGKGVVFDTGGLDIKPASGMKLMHKDMGGAANAIGLAYLIMKHNLPVSLRLSIPTVENSIDAHSFRPSDIITMKNGITVEVTNTDAEGRLILAEPLHEESLKNPDLLIDFATLTGASRVAVGTEISSFFSNNDDISSKLYNYGESIQDSVWRLPIAQCYKKTLKSNFADIVNADLSPFAGATKAALFLEMFLPVKQPNWIHFDIMAWNPVCMKGKPVGGEMMGVRSMFSVLTDRYPL